MYAIKCQGHIRIMLPTPIHIFSKLHIAMSILLRNSLSVGMSL